MIEELIKNYNLLEERIYKGESWLEESENSDDPRMDLAPATYANLISEQNEILFQIDELAYKALGYKKVRKKGFISCAL
jgi:hypothetical protein